MSKMKERFFPPSFAAAVFLALFAGSKPSPSVESAAKAQDFSRARRDMVERDLRRRGIKDQRVLEAMGLVPRHLFVGERLRASAYEDRPLPIGEGQTISQPYVVALMTEWLELKGGERVLEVGTGSGYHTAILSSLAKEVSTIEIVPSLAKRARETLTELGYGNVSFKSGDGFFGWEEKAPFDAILVAASAEKVPDPLWRQLQEQGRLVMPLGSAQQGQRLVRVRKLGGRRHVEDITGVMFVPMTGATQEGSR
jgi:protein-L-isoaspartate(D-aspartate) O-methyltransferase